MIQRRLRAITGLLILGILLSFTTTTNSRQSGRERQPHRITASNKTRLVLLIVIDQFRYDYLERFADLFGAGGFRRLMNQGALFTNANYSYIPTFTAPGHAAIATGSVPAANGIVGNVWFDREAGRVRVMVSDPAAHLVTDKGPARSDGAFSPRNLIGSTLGDQIRLSNNFQSKVVAVSLKDRAAILPGGQRPTGVFWFSEDTGTFVSSDYYSKELPGWVKKFNASERPDRYFGKKWERALTANAYRRSQSQRPPVQSSVLGSKFPYILTGGEEIAGPKFYNAFQLTPFASEYLADFARAAVESESLGTDDFPDLLSISFSSPDLTGHYYGPDSEEIEDTFIRLDRAIANFLSFIDRRVDPSNTIIAVTGDHGVAPVPEYLRAVGFDADRIDGRALAAGVNQALVARYGEGKWVAGFVNDQLYLDRKLLDAGKIDLDEAERIAGEAALRVPGIITYFTRKQILEGRVGGRSLDRRVVNGFNRARSGDVWIITKPFAFISEGSLATTHGSAYSYDTHVPVIIVGRGIRPGRYRAECSPSDIAPTVASLLGVEPPANCVGRVLTEALERSR
jgi:predicted AlkP superfamily pyrophosphatase or phosphodiesterase